MKIEDMVMVINNQKGIEKNFLCSFENFVKQCVTNACDNFWEVAEVISELNHASEKDNSFCVLLYEKRCRLFYCLVILMKF